MSDEIWLEIPAQPEYVFLARVTAAKLATRQSFSIDEIEDLRLAMDESLSWLISAADPEGSVRVQFEDTKPGIRIRGVAERPGPRRPPVSDMSNLILDALVDEHAVGDDDGRPFCELLKKHGGD